MIIKNKTTITIVITILTLTNCISQTNFGYGLKIPTEEQIKSIPFIPDFSLPSKAVLPSKIDLSDKMPPVGNQGYQGSCAAFAIAYALKSYQEKKQNGWPFIENGSVQYDRICSPSFVYNSIKKITNNFNCQEGIYFKEGFDLLTSMGTSFWSEFPYTEQDCSRQPDLITVQRALSNKISSHRLVNPKNLPEIKYNLSVGNPVAIGVMLDDFFQPDGFSSFTNQEHYTFIPKSILDPNKYHAMLCVGYNDQNNSFQVLNSWGDNWGNAGYVDIPYTWFPVVVLEAYVMIDAIQFSAFVGVKNKEVESSKSFSSSELFSSWFKEGYFRDYKEIRLGLTNLNVKDSSATVVFTDIKNNTEIKMVTYIINTPQIFYYNNKKVTFTITSIDKARRNPLSKAAFFNLTIDNSTDKETKERLDKIKLFIEQKNSLDKMIKQ